jgi:hypothetical protein
MSQTLPCGGLFMICIKVTTKCSNLGEGKVLKGELYVTYRTEQKLTYRVSPSFPGTVQAGKPHGMYSCYQILLLYSSRYIKPKQNTKQEQLNFPGDGRDLGCQEKSATFTGKVCIAHFNIAPVFTV